ncbi:MAG: N-acetylmuramoyl-L-alanine amidase [Lachnospiraceae bacterium]|nr:N-acetylmuramoyl-L-alanine amidase [Lachnospiraceae bacterium]
MIGWTGVRSKRPTLFFAVLIMALLLSSPVLAGWNTTGKNTKVTYTDETGAAVTGFQAIGGLVYYFDAAGVLQTGWVNTTEGLRYFRTKGKAGGKLGSMIAGYSPVIDGNRYGFDADGTVLTGFQTIGNYSYFFSTTGRIGVYGRAVTNKFRTLPDGRKAFFQENGRMAYKKWVKNHTYYVDETGNKVCSTITKDGYVLKANGKAGKKLTDSQFVKLKGKWYFYKKKKGLLKDKVFKYKGDYYYVDEDGVRQRGWITWKGHDYYFLSNGKAVIGDKKIDGEKYTFNSKGQVKGSRGAYGTKATTGKASILILCGHGQGDSGAVGCGGQYAESAYTRDFGKRIYDALLKIDSVNAFLFNTNYDMYQQMKATVGSVGSFSGSGSKGKKVLSAVRGNSRIPDPTKFDYVLEIHFNATAENAKDPGGDGKKKGTGTYVNSYKSSANRGIDRKIISALNALGLNTWGSGVYGSSGLLNAKVYTEIGINYSLLETCFIDDKDDMKFYLKKRDDMAEAVAGAIAKYWE